MTAQSPTDLAGPVPNLPTADRLTGRVCLVVGGTRGIGRATALRMAAEGAAVVAVSGRNASLGEQVAEELNGLGAESLFVPADVTQEADLARLVELVVGRFGRLEAVCNNAGFQERRAPLLEQSDDAFAQVFDTNVRFLFNAMRFEIPALLASGGGEIVNTTSVSGIRNPYPGFALYNASKAAAISLTRSAALEYAPQGVRINSVAPGRVVTDMMLSTGVGDMQAVANGLPLRRMGHPEEIAMAAVWLLSDESSYVVGHVLCADGGFLAG